MAKKYDKEDEGYTKEYVKKQILDSLAMPVTHKQLTDASWLLDNVACDPEVIFKVVYGEKTRERRLTYSDFEELARIFVDRSYYFSEGRYYLFGTDEHKLKWEDEVEYGG